MKAAFPGSGLILVSPRNEDHDSLQRILRYSPWDVHGAITARAGLDLLRTQRLVSVVICNRTLPDGDWKLVMGELGQEPARPKFIVSARVADERLWAEALNLGAFDVLFAAPFQTEEVIRIVEGAWLAWNRERGQSAVPRIGPDSAWSQEGTGGKVQAATVAGGWE